MDEIVNSMHDHYGRSFGAWTSVPCPADVQEERNEVSRTVVDLCQTGLLAKAGTFAYQITVRGKEALEFVTSQCKQPVRVTRPIAGRRADSRRPPSVGVSALHPRRDRSSRPGPSKTVSLAAELAARLRRQSPAILERATLRVLAATGRLGPDGDTVPLGAHGDNGLDHVVWHDPYDEDPWFVRCLLHRENHTVEHAEVEALLSSMRTLPTRRGVLVTTGRIAPAERLYAAQVRAAVDLDLIDADQLAELMLEHGIGVSETRRLGIDDAFFSEG